MDQLDRRPAALEPPVARREPGHRDIHGTRASDDYAWMSGDRSALADYLRAERDYYDAATARSRPLRDALYDEMSQRLSPTDRSVSWREGAFVYYTRTSPGKQYRSLCRQVVTDGRVTADEVLLDEDELAGESAYFTLGVRAVSPDGRLLAYSVDTDGDEVYVLRIRDLTTGRDLVDVVRRSYYGCAWSADSATLLYVTHDESYRPYRVLRHRVGTTESEDTVVLDEPDERFSVYVERSRSGAFAVISVESRDTSEVWLLAADDVSGDPVVVARRRAGVEYAVDHVAGADGGDLYIVTNDGAAEFRLMRAPVAEPGRERWTEVVAGNAAERLHAVDAFAGHLVLSLRRDGFPLVRVLDLATGATRDEPAGIEAGIVYVSGSGKDDEPVHDPYDSPTVTLVTESLVEPRSWWRVDLATGKRELAKRADVPGYDPARYRTCRIEAVARDGERVPVTLAHRADVARDGTAPCLLYGYGAYEASSDPRFHVSRASLLDRGVVYAIAHVRGGGERGRRWWEAGRLRRKRTTFTDFVDVADALAADGWVDGTRIVSRGLSAGGLLQGAVYSTAPARWRAVVAEVPFVDVVNTMLDPAIPLTVTEYDEWGDPRDPDDFAYLASYSPYETVPLGPRPDLLVTGSLHDARVMIHEPAKWVARLRATAPDSGSGSGGTGLVLFRPELGSAAHSGPSGRYDRLRYQEEILAFVLDQVGLG
jgi:oligopeptidase B